jgi:hypothetical protein
MGPQPPSLPHTDASRRARRSPFANKTKGAWCRSPPQLLSRSFYAWLWPSLHWILRIHSAARFLAAPNTETRFPCLQTSSGAQNTGNRAQARRKAPEVPRRAISLRGDAFQGDGNSMDSCLEGVGIIAVWFAAKIWICKKSSPPRSALEQCLTAQPARLREDDKTAID